MKKRLIFIKTSNYFYLFCGLICHILVYLEYLYSGSARNGILKIDWMSQFLGLTIFLCVLSVIAFIFSKSKVVLFILSLHFALVILLAYPVGHNVVSILALNMILVLGAHLYLPSPHDIILSVSGSVLLFVFLLPHKRWDPLIPLPSMHNTLIAGLCLLLFIYIIQIAKKEFLRRIQQSSDMDMLQQNLTRLTLANLEFQKFATNIEEAATESERKRITREIHDTMGYTLTNVAMAMEAALRLVPPDDNRLLRLLELIKMQARDGLKETRNALYQLRQQEGVKLKGIHAIYRLSALFEEITGIKVILEFGNVPLSLTDAVEEFLFRLIQEGMVNAFKHAKPTEIRIYCHLNSNGLYVTIRDNGQGCFELNEGIGMSGIRERLAPFNGRLEVNNNAIGFALSVFIPVDSLYIKNV